MNKVLGFINLTCVVFTALVVSDGAVGCTKQQATQAANAIVDMSVQACTVAEDILGGAYVTLLCDLIDATAPDLHKVIGKQMVRVPRADAVKYGAHPAASWLVPVEP
jgi:hypothetical protein